METKEFIETVNKSRKDSLGNWYTFVGNVNGKRVELKAFGLWNQILRVDGINHGGCMGNKTVKEWKAELESVL